MGHLTFKNEIFYQHESCCVRANTSVYKKLIGLINKRNKLLSKKKSGHLFG